MAFVGSSGCGKSTLSKLISGLYTPWEGEILFDGKPIPEIDRSVFTGSVAVVDQDIILFEDTIANNIKMWDDSIEDFEMILAQDPTMILLDEATSALDARTEYEVVNSIKNRGISCIVIAHRLSTIRDCDEILVLDQGKVVERGTHEELLALGGKYKTLVTSE